jgi:hypothetical protein
VTGSTPTDEIADCHHDVAVVFSDFVGFTDCARHRRRDRSAT